MVKVLISGYYGFHNLGDEAILTSLIEELHAASKGAVEITVLTNTPKETAEQFGVKTVKRDAFFQVVGAIRRTDILLNGGGSLLQDDTSNRSIYYYLAIMKLARLFGKRVASISCGIGPIHSRFNRWLVKRAVDKSYFTTVRDPDSYDLLRQLGADMQRVSVTSDLVLGLPIQNKERGRSILEQAGILPRDEAGDDTSGEKGSGGKGSRQECLGQERLAQECVAQERLGQECLRHGGVGQGGLRQGRVERKPLLAMAMRAKDFTNPRMLEKLENLILTLSEDYNVMFLPFFYKADMKLRQLLAQGKKAEQLEGRYVFIDVKCSAEEYMSLVANCAVLVGTRLHAMIFSLMAGTPFLGISYDPKVDSFLDLVDKKPVSHIDQFSESEVAQAVLAVKDNWEQARHEVVKQREKLRASMGINTMWLESLVSSKPLPPVRTGRELDDPRNEKHVRTGREADPSLGDMPDNEKE